jgi:hypothetical protein
MGGMDVRPAAWRDPVRMAVAVAGIVLAGLFAAGCGQEPAGQRLARAGCTRFAISAIEHHLVVRSLPTACHGLTTAQVNAAADTALAVTAGRKHRVNRERLAEIRPLLGYTLARFAAQPNLPPVTLQESPAAGGPPLALVALVTWLATVGLGGLMMARWALGRLRAGGGQRRSLPAINVTHFGLALAGLAAWIGYLVTGLTGLAWTACALLLPVAGFGMVLVSRWFPERPTTDTAAAVAPAAPIAVGAVAAPAPPGPPPALAVPAPPPAWRPPALIVVTHVALATATILFAVLAAIAAR